MFVLCRFAVANAVCDTSVDALKSVKNLVLMSDTRKSLPKFRIIRGGSFQFCSRTWLILGDFYLDIAQAKTASISFPLLLQGVI